MGPIGNVHFDYCAAYSTYTLNNSIVSLCLHVRGNQSKHTQSFWIFR